MTISTGQVTVGVAPTAIDGADRNPMRIHVHNLDNTSAIWIGNETVTPTTGLPLFKLDSIELVLNPYEVLYAITDNGTVNLAYFKQAQ